MIKNRKPIIAIDGPCAAGKTTLAKLLAEKLGVPYFDTGALYRTVALYIDRPDLPIEAHDNLLDPNYIREKLSAINMRIEFINGEQHMFLDDLDVTGDLRTPRLSALASDVSALPEVRDFLLETQRSAARENGVVMEGRDITTVVLPKADAKFYMTALPSVRSERRLLQLWNQGVDIKLAEVIRDISHRDFQDTHREIAPLKQTKDQIYIDTSKLGIQEVLNLMMSAIKQKLTAGAVNPRAILVLDETTLPPKTFDAVADKSCDTQTVCVRMLPQPELIPQHTLGGRGMWKWKTCQWMDGGLGFPESGIDDYARFRPGDILYIQSKSLTIMVVDVRVTQTDVTGESKWVWAYDVKKLN